MIERIFLSMPISGLKKFKNVKNNNSVFISYSSRPEGFPGQLFTIWPKKMIRAERFFFFYTGGKVIE